ncbi:MAG: HD domain-containing protein [Anaerolineae bacterium]
MDRTAWIQQTVAHVRAATLEEGSGHDWWHIYRVWQTARQIGAAEGADLIVVELAALLHDIADWKFHGGDETVGPRVAGEWLRGLGVDAATIAHVQAIIAGVSFKGEAEAPSDLTLEGRCVQDADRLDAIGAVGVARVFAYCGFKGLPIHDPEHPPRRGMTAAQYKQNNGSGINHFYEKLLLLKDRMHTPTARRMAEERHAFLEAYLAQFYREWPDAAPPA